MVRLRLCHPKGVQSSPMGTLVVRPEFPAPLHFYIWKKRTSVSLRAHTWWVLRLACHQVGVAVESCLPVGHQMA